MPHILPKSANETIIEEIGDYYPVFYSVSPAQLTETLQKLYSTHHVTI